MAFPFGLFSTQISYFMYFLSLVSRRCLPFRFFPLMPLLISETSEAQADIERKNAHLPIFLRKTKRYHR